MYQRYPCPHHSQNGCMQVSGLILDCCNDSRTTTCKIDALVTLAKKHSALEKRSTKAEKDFERSNVVNYSLRKQLERETEKNKQLEKELESLKKEIELLKTQPESGSGPDDMDMDTDEYIINWKKELNRLFGPTELVLKDPTELVLKDPTGTTFLIDETHEPSISSNWITEYNKKKAMESMKNPTQKLIRSKSVTHSLSSMGEPEPKKRAIDPEGLGSIELNLLQ